MNLVSKLIESGYTVTVITPEEQPYFGDPYPGIRFIALKNLNRRSVHPWYDIQLTFELFMIYKRIKPDLVLHYTVKPNIFGGFAAGLLGIPSIAAVTGLGFAFLHKGPVQVITKWLYTLSGRFHRKFIFENQDDLAFFLDLNIIKPNQGIALKGCGVNSAHFTPILSSENKTDTVFTFIGRLLYDKGIREFVEAGREIKKRYPGTEFWIVGDPDPGNPSSVREDDLKNWINEKTVLYHGSKTDIREVVSLSSCIVLPSYREGLPKVILEAMSMAKPVITSDAPGCRETVIDGENGFLVEAKNANSLARAFEKFIRLPDAQKKQMGMAGRRMVLEVFEDQIIARQLANIIEKELETA